MAQFNVYGIDELVRKLNMLGEIDEIAPKMLDAGMEVLQPEVVAEASKHKDTGAMSESIKPTGYNHVGGSYYICTRPTGKDKKGVRNMEKMSFLEYGVKGRPATPVITAAVIRAETKTVSAMRKVFEEEVHSM